MMFSQYVNMCNCHVFFKMKDYPIIPVKTENAGKIITLASKVSFPIKCEGEWLSLIERERKTSQKQTQRKQQQSSVRVISTSSHLEK